MTADDDLTWSFRRGEWYAVLGSRATVLLPPAERARAARLWELVEFGADAEEVLDALLHDGLRDLTGFVLVGRAGDATRVLVRGPGQAHLAVGDEVLHVVGDPQATWVERVATGVTRIRLEVGAETEASDVAVGTGLVRAGSVEHPPVPAAPVGAAPDTVASAVLPDLDDTDATDAPDAPDAPDPDVGIDHDGQTRGGDEPTGPIRDLPGIPGQQAAPRVTRPVARLLLSTGEAVPVDRVVLVGRAPTAGRVPEGEEPRVVAVPSPHQEISSTHLEVRPGSGADHGSAVVTDLGSTNGTLLRQPGLPVEDLRPGVGVQLIPGAVIDLGDGQTIQVIDP